MNDAQQMWNERFGSEEYVYGLEPNDFLREQAMTLPRGKVLSLAEGEGRNAVWLATQGFDVWSVDSSSVGVAKTLKLAESRGVTVHATVRQRIHQQVVKGLRRGGVYILEAYTPAQIALGTGGPKDPSFMLTVELLADELSGLQFDRLEEVIRDVVEGPLHTGQASVVQVIATSEIYGDLDLPVN